MILQILLVDQVQAWTVQQLEIRNDEVSGLALQQLNGLKHAVG